MIKIDLGNKELKEAKEIYAIPSVPYVEVYQNGKLLFEQIPDYKTDDQIRAIAEKQKEDSFEALSKKPEDKPEISQEVRYGPREQAKQMSVDTSSSMELDAIHFQQKAGGQHSLMPIATSGQNTHIRMGGHDPGTQKNSTIKEVSYGEEEYEIQEVYQRAKQSTPRWEGSPYSS